MKIFALRLIVPALVIALVDCLVVYQPVYLGWFDITLTKFQLHWSVYALIALAAVPVSFVHVYIQDVIAIHRATK